MTGAGAPTRTPGESARCRLRRRRTPAPGTCSAPSRPPRRQKARPLAAVSRHCINGAIGLTPGQTARVLSDGSAAAPAEAPAAVKLAIAAGNLIHTRPYPEPDVHYGTLAKLWPAYDCSGATSFVLYGAGVMGPSALDSTGLESYGLPGPGRWITVYANSAHAWIVVAGIALDTASYGGAGDPSRLRAPVALGTTGEPQRRDELRRSTSAWPMRRRLTVLLFLASASAAVAAARPRALRPPLGRSLGAEPAPYGEAPAPAGDPPEERNGTVPQGQAAAENEPTHGFDRGFATGSAAALRALLHQLARRTACSPTSENSPSLAVGAARLAAEQTAASQSAPRSWPRTTFRTTGASWRSPGAGTCPRTVGRGHPGADQGYGRLRGPCRLSRT